MESSGKEQNYWPGFVDALSNVVLTLVFVLVVFVFALVMASNKVQQKAMEIHTAAADQQREWGEISTLKNELLEAKAELDRLRPAAGKKLEETLIDIEKATQNKGDSSVSIQASKDGVKLIYPPGTFKIAQNSISSLDNAINAAKPKSGSYEIVIRSTIGGEPYSIAQRLAYYRAISLRNHLMGLGLNVTITSQIVRSETGGDGHVEILFRQR